jgi:CBS domain-containing protein
MTTELTVVAPTATVAEAAALMSVRHVGSVLVMAGPELSGIFTERDIVRALASDFDAARDHVSMWMTSAPVCASPDDLVNEALARMIEGGFRHLPVLEDGRPCGIVSLRDLAPRSDHPTTSRTSNNDSA